MQMSFTAKKINDANAQIDGSINKSAITDKFDKIAIKMAKNAKIDGFRKGKIPANLIKSRYKEQIEKDAQQEAIQDLLDSALKELNIAPNALIGSPIISKFDEKDEQIDLSIKISMIPPINIENIDAFIPDIKLPEITESAITDRINEIAKNRASLVEISQDRQLQKDDTAHIDFEGFVDGKAFDGGKAQGFNLVIGSNQFIPGFEDSLIGMKKGEEKSIKVTFPKNYGAKHLADKEAEFKVKLHKIMQKDILKIDDAFAKSIVGEDGDLDSLKDMIKSQLQMEAKNELYNKELKDKLIENLLQNVTFDLPEIIIEQEMDILFRNELSTLQKEEIEKLQNDKQEAKNRRQKHKDEALKSVQITFITDALAKKRNIVVQDNEVLQTIYYEAMMTAQDPKAVVEYYQSNNLIPAIKMAMTQDRVLGALLDSKLENAESTKSSAKKD